MDDDDTARLRLLLKVDEVGMRCALLIVLLACAACDLHSRGVKHVTAAQATADQDDCERATPFDAAAFGIAIVGPSNADTERCYRAKDHAPVPIE